MNRLAALGRRFCDEQHGVTSIEYALIAVLIATGIAGAVTPVGTTLYDLFATVAEAFSQDSPGGGPPPGVDPPGYPW